MKCKYCEAESGNDDGDPVVHHYNVGEILVDCCGECLEDKIPTADQLPIILPDGWEVAPSDVLNDIKKGNKAFREAHQMLVGNNQFRHITSGYIYDFSSYIKRVISYFENHDKLNMEFKESLGLHGAIPESMLSGAYCPACKSPLIKTSQQVLSMAISDIVPGEERRFNQIEGFATRKKRSFVCLGCLTSYIEDRDYE